jgi:phage host-nuclease inhibitor protein Gam
MINPLLLNDLEEMETEATEENRERFKINDLSSLTWAMRKLSALRTKQDEVHQIANQEVERIESYRNKEVVKLIEHEVFFNSLIADYAERMRIEDPKFKQKTPYGGISFRKSPAKWNYEEKFLLEHLENNNLNDFIRTKKEPDKVMIKDCFQVTKGKVYDTNGELVIGITVTESPDKLVVKVGE